MWFLRRKKNIFLPAGPFTGGVEMEHPSLKQITTFLEMNHSLLIVIIHCSVASLF